MKLHGKIEMDYLNGLGKIKKIGLMMNLIIKEKMEM